MSAGLEVSGGVGGIRAATDDMERAAALLTGAADEVGELGVRLAVVAASPGLLATAAVAPATFAMAESAVLTAAVGPVGLVAAAAHLELLGFRLRAAALAYDATEEAATVLNRAVQVTAVLTFGLEAAGGVLTPPIGRLSGLPTPGAGADGVAVAGALETVVAAVPGSVRQAAHTIGALAYDSPFLRDGHAVVVAGGAQPASAPSGVADLIRGVASCYTEGGAAPGTVRVVGITHADGGRAWVVEIPGTQEWSPLAGANPFDLSGDVASMAGGSAAAGEVVEAAMAAAGVRPGEPVLLAGHSLGGMVAAGLASDPAFRSRYRVTHVLTAGSPVAGYPVPASIQVMSLEHSDDVVPSLDGRRDPDRVSWVTVRRPLLPGSPLIDPQGTHDVAAYALTAQLVDASGDPSLVTWRAGLAPFLAGPGVRASSTLVVGTRRRR